MRLLDHLGVDGILPIAAVRRAPGRRGQVTRHLLLRLGRRRTAAQQLRDHAFEVVDVPPHVEQDLVEQFALARRIARHARRRHHGRRSPLLLRKVARQNRRRHHAVLLDGRDLLGHVLQLADVAAPIVALQHPARLVVERDGRHTVLYGHIGGELAEQQEDVLAPVAQRRHRDGHRVEPVVEVFAEPPLLDGLLQIHVRRRHDPHVGALHPGRTDAHEFARLQHAQQAHLRRERQLGHLVQKNRPAVGLLEIALASFDGTRERPLLVAEQLRIDRAFGDGTAVDGNIFIVLAGRIGVDDLREKLLAHAALARHQHRQIGRCDAHGHFERPIQKLRIADDAEALFQ